jgi:lipoate-protein ligase A
MKELLDSKLKAAREFKNITIKTASLSMKTDYEKVNLLIEERQEHIEKINVINEEISKAEEPCSSFTESDEIKRLKSEICEVFKETAEMDKLIRKNVNDELKNLKNILNQPETFTKLVNIRA